MATVTIIQPNTATIINKVRVAAYCRVSSSSDDQLNSYQAQLTYYSHKFENSDTEELIDLYLLKHLTGDIAWRHPEDGVAQRERLRQERIATREQEQRNESPCDERVEPVSEVREEVGETPDENWEAAVSDCDDFEETEDEGMAMSM